MTNTHDQQWIVDNYRSRVRNILDGTDTGPEGFLHNKFAPRTLMEITAKAFNVTSDQIKGHGKASDIVAARWAIVWIMHYRRGSSSTQIANALNKCHTAVLYAIKNMDRGLLNDPDYNAKLQQILRTVGLK